MTFKLCAGNMKWYYENKQSQFGGGITGNEFYCRKIMPSSERMFNDDPLAQRADVLSLIIIGEELVKVNKKSKREIPSVFPEAW